MKLPLSWLNEYVKVDDIDAQELAEKLTRAGLQVEAVETVGEAELSDYFVVVDVLECENHPDSDHLHVCKVSDGAETYQVVCGAPNMRQGIKTAFAKIGAVVPEGGFKIKKGKLRGVESFGMCCSATELKLGSDSSGIIEFPADVAAGTFVRDAVGAEKPEIVLDVDVTWNRPDALSIVGLAREFAAILGREVKLPAVDFVEEEKSIDGEVSVSVEEPEKCLRYVARVVESVEDGPSPEFMRKRLELCGIRSLGLVVDVTNYVLLELGAPMHAFDHTRLAGRKVVVRNAREGETIKTLDGVDRKLDTSMLVICDAERPSAVAGVMGGAESEIASQTRSVMLESALFEPATVKETAGKLSLSSDSAYRYIRGVDKDVADFASRRAAHLLQKYGAARIARGAIDVDNRPMPLNADVKLDFGRARKLIGIDIDDGRMREILVSLGLEDKGDGVFGIPSWRWDLQLEADLVEEIARMYGLDNIPDAMPSAPSVSNLDESQFKARARVRELCMALGFSEAMHYSFLSGKELDDFDSRAETKAKRLEIPEPVSAEYGFMRDTLMAQMMSSLGRNASRQLPEAKLFEIGKVFSADLSERESLALGFLGPVARMPLEKRAALGEEEAVLWMKGAVEELVGFLHSGKLEFAPAEHPAFAKGSALSVVLNGRPVGIMGALSQAMRHPYRLTTQMVLCEIDFKSIVKRIDSFGKVSPPPVFPSVMRDVAIKAAKTVTHEEIVKVIRKNGGRELTKVELFDIFKPKADKDGVRSLAYSLEFRSAEKTLTDEEVGRSFQRIVEALKATAGIEVREG
jgi:phenylalanyl-tRNA synthetase beta chain